MHILAILLFLALFVLAAELVLAMLAAAGPRLAHVIEVGLDAEREGFSRPCPRLRRAAA